MRQSFQLLFIILNLKISENKPTYCCVLPSTPCTALMVNIFRIYFTIFATIPDFSVPVKLFLQTPPYFHRMLDHAVRISVSGRLTNYLITSIASYFSKGLVNIENHPFCIRDKDAFFRIGKNCSSQALRLFSFLREVISTKRTTCRPYSVSFKGSAATKTVYAHHFYNRSQPQQVQMFYVPALLLSNVVTKSQ